MKSSVNHVTFDSLEPYSQAQFWCAVFGVDMDPEDQPGDPAAIVRLEGQAPLLFEQVPDSKQLKNRVHIDLQPELPRDDEVQRIIGLGATQLADRRRPDGSGWVVMADREGNEFCIERSAAERSANTL